MCTQPKGHMSKSKALETALNNKLLGSHEHLKKCIFSPTPSVFATLVSVKVKWPATRQLEPPTENLHLADHSMHTCRRFDSHVSAVRAVEQPFLERVWCTWNHEEVDSDVVACFYAFLLFCQCFWALLISIFNFRLSGIKWNLVVVHTV